MRPHQLLSRFFMLLVVCLSMTAVAGCRPGGSSMPSAQRGFMSIAASDLESFKVIRLDGEWAFYPGELLTPADFRAGAEPKGSGYINLPSTWRGLEIDGKRLEGQGCATFRLVIAPVAGAHKMVLRLFDISSAYRLWVNGKPLAESGTVSKDLAGEVVSASLQMPGFTVDNSPVELVLQVSNHHFRDGGVTASILFGEERDVERWQIRQWGVALFCIGSLLIMGLYHLVFFLFRRVNRAPLYFGLYCLIWCANILVSNSSGWVLSLFLPLPQLLLLRLDLFLFLLSLPVGYAFFCTLYGQEFSSRLLRFLWPLTLVVLLFSLLAPLVLLTSFLPAYYLATIALILYSIAMLYRAYRNSREGAVFILAGFVVLGSVAVNDILYQLQIIQSVYLIHIGMFFFVLFQAFALSLRFAKAFSAVELLSRELGCKNLDLEEQMNERSRLEQKVVQISEDERRRISHDLHDGLCQQLTAARLRFSVLKRRLTTGAEEQPELAQLSELLDESVNHAYDLSRGLCPVEFDPVGIIPSLEELASRFALSSGIDIEFSQRRRCDNCTNSHLIQLYRIAQEAITNAVKHASAENIRVEFDCTGVGIEIKISDNGIGRKAAARSSGGLGSGIMQYRARMIGGVLELADVEGGGTSVVCKLPCAIISENGAGYDKL